MKKKDLILKWLDHEPLSETESQAFKDLDAFDSFTKISETAKLFGAPQYDVEENFDILSSKLKDRKQIVETEKAFKYRIWMLRIAAVFVLGMGVYLAFFNVQSTIIRTIASEKTTITLPDQSTVSMNAFTSISYDKTNWNTNRQLELTGEAYFKVAKGKKFDVKTASGIVSVLGTQFNVESRDNYFEVTCFEGLVSVTYNDQEVKLPAGNALKIIDGKSFKGIATTQTPDWTQNISTFKSIPFHFVVEEFERQYDIKIITKNIDQNTVFTGNFVHSDFQSALQSISIPMRLKYKIDNNLITLYRE